MNILKNIRIKPCLLGLFPAFILMAAFSGAAFAAVEVEIKAPAGSASYDFSVDLIADEAEPYAGIEFGLTLSDENALKFTSFTKGEAVKGANNSPFMASGGIHYFGFYTDSNAYQGNQKVGTMNFTYSGSSPQTITITKMMIARIEGKASVGTYKDSPAYIINVSRETSYGTTYTVTFNSQGGSAVSPITGITPGTKITKPADPTRTGYTFDGWHKEAALTNKWDFANDTVTQDITLYAKWLANVGTTYTVTFNSQGGSAVSQITGVLSGAKITRPADPTRAGYTFGGWYKETALTNIWDFANDTITQNISLYARWIENSSGATTGGGGGGGGISGTGTGPAPSTVSILDPDVPLGTISFSDVPESHWAYQYVMYLAGKGFVTGKTETSFAPSASITRAEFITILARMSGESLPASYNGPFTDVVSGSYYEQAVAWGVNAKVVNGTSETTFSPNSLILRQEMAAMIVRYAAYKNFNFLKYNEPIDFKDSAQIHAYAKEPVSVMQQADVINGYEDSSFRPQNNATRAEAAKMLALVHRLMNQ